MDITNELFEPPYGLSDIYVVGLQEMVELNTGNITKGKDENTAAIWHENIKSSLNKNGRGFEFIALTQKVMVGLYIVVFIKSTVAHSVRGVKKFRVKTGLSGLTGNKGGVAVRFAIDDTSFSFINV